MSPRDAADVPLNPHLVELIRATKGFMPEDEGAALHRHALAHLPSGPGLEIGSYCGKSALYFGDAARQSESTFFTVDHHHGSEENQAGWEHHDSDVVDARTGRMDTLPFLRRTLEDAGLEKHVIAVVGYSPTVAEHWRTPLALLFIDGGHAEEHAQADYEGWAPWVQPGGVLLIHDVFEHPEDGGQAPFHVYRRALESGDFTEVDAVGSLRALERSAGEPGRLPGVTD